ncbi:MAG: lipopolysaccharide biosynthesis protein [Planctomycetaceae bacterium]
MKPVRDLLKHSSVYMIGQVIARMASVVLLPFYTNVFSPADYGVTAILDLMSSLLATVVASGLVTAVTRHHFETEDSAQTDRVWWTGLSMVALVCALTCLPLWLIRHTLADWTLGAEVTQGPWFYTLTILTLCFCVFGMVLDAYLRVLKWSGVFVVISLTRLLINIGLNVWLIVGVGMGVEGLLVGNLIATILQTVVLSTIFVKTRGPFRLDRVIGRHMLRFAVPLVLTAVVTMLMHEADRFFLRIWSSMDVVGVYSLAHKLGFAVNTLCVLPFLSIWTVAIYDIERLPNAPEVFRRIFGWFVSGLGILLLGAALTVHPVLPLLTRSDYGEAVDLVSVILLGLFVFSLSFMFEVPALLKKKTRVLVPAAILGLAVNVGANVLLIPLMGAWGAGWAGVLTYAASSLTILLLCREVMKIDYSWLHLGLTTSGLCLTYVAVRYGCFPHVGIGAQLALSVLVCGLWTVVLFGKDGLEAGMDYLGRRRTMANSTTAISEDTSDVPAEEPLAVSSSSTSAVT